MFHPETERIKKIKENTISLCEAIKKQKYKPYGFGQILIQEMKLLQK